MSKTIIVSNRLPVRIQVIDGQISYKRSEGGLATGLGSIYKEGDNIWIGWPGTLADDAIQQQQIEDKLRELNLESVFLTQQETENYYGGFSNGILWPICHYMPSYATYLQEYWEAYEKVNHKFAEAVLAKVKTGDIVWVHDYQLLLVPQIVREQMPDISIGYFHHIPFPSYEVFRQIPWRDHLLNGVLGADLIGFHTYDDLRHFISAATRILGVSSSVNQLMVNNRRVIVDAFPMSIDYEKFVELAADERVQRNIGKARQAVREARMILSVDRLDYSKGILQRLQAFDLFLKTHPEYKEKVSLFMIVVPSRDRVPHYRELKREIDRTVSNINAHNQTLGWQPVFYLYRSITPELLSAMYQTADVCLVTPLRDGMNLVSKEYVASRTDEQGVLILSEMAGASKELTEAFIINPNDVVELANAIYRALEMPIEEQQERMKAMRSTVEKFNIHQWVKLFMQRLSEAKDIQKALDTKQLSTDGLMHIRQQYDNSAKRIIFLDYDGTLMGFNVDPLQVRPDNELCNLLEGLAMDQKNKLVIVSGRMHETLDEWLGHFPLDLIAEHGAWTKRYRQPWQKHPGMNHQWKHEILPIMEIYTDRTPGAFIEEKSYSLSWHYRKVELGLGEQRAIELEENLKVYAIDRGLQILQGEKVIEIKSNLVNKGNAARVWLEEEGYDFILAAGDDYTDEDTFKAMPPHAITIKVGANISAAKYGVTSFQDVRKLLKELTADRVPTGGQAEISQSENGLTIRDSTKLLERKLPVSQQGQPASDMSTPLPGREEISICFAHVAYPLAEIFEKRATGLSYFQVWNRDELRAKIADAHVLVVSGFWNNALLDNALKLRFIQSIGAGYDQFALDELRARGIRLASAKGVNRNAVSEHAIAMILALARHIHTGRDHQRAHHWRGMISDLSRREDELGGKTLLIAGLGGIGSRLAKLAKVFDMHVIATKRNPERGAGAADEIYTPDKLKELLPRADFVALTCPLTPETRNMIDAEAFAAMKPSAYLINIARGGCVDEPALLAAVQQGQIAGAAIDHFWDEPLSADSPFWDLENVLITPHTAGETRLYEENLFDILLENLERLWRGEKELRNQVV